MQLIPTVIADTGVDDRGVGSSKLSDGCVGRREKKREFLSVEEQGVAGGAGLTIDTTAFAAVMLALQQGELCSTLILVAVRGEVISLP